MAMLSLILLLAACGQTTTPATNGAGAGLQALTTPSATSGTPTPTAIPLPYTFPKQWLPAPDSAHLPSQIGSFIFSPSSPQSGYICGVTSSSADNSAATPPYVVATNTGGQSWHTVSGSAAHTKSACNLFIDQNNANDIFAAAGDMRGQLPLYRSQDGGVTWKAINQPIITNMSTMVMQVAVVQSRLIAMIGINGEGVPPHSFYSSDDGGQSWAPLNIMANGASVDAGEQLWFDGPALIIEGGPSCSQGCGYSAPVSGWRGDRQRLTDPLSSQPPSPNKYYQSTDGGRTWTPFPTPASNLSNLTFTHSAAGSTIYALGTAAGVPNQPAATTVAFYSADGGAHWRQLPTLAGVENGYLDPSSLGAFGASVLPDGSVETGALHTTGDNNSSAAGMFMLRPDDAAPAWQPLIAMADGSFWQSIPTTTGVRIWSTRTQPGGSSGQLVYFDLP